MWRIGHVVPPEKLLASEPNQACSDIRGRCLLLHPAPSRSSVTGITHKYAFIFRSLNKKKKKKKNIDTSGIQSNKIICELRRSNIESPEASELWAQSCAHSSPPNIYQHLPKFRITLSCDCALKPTIAHCCNKRGRFSATAPRHRVHRTPTHTQSLLALWLNMEVVSDV